MKALLFVIVVVNAINVVTPCSEIVAAFRQCLNCTQTPFAFSRLSALCFRSFRSKILYYKYRITHKPKPTSDPNGNVNSTVTVKPKPGPQGSTLGSGSQPQSQSSTLQSPTSLQSLSGSQPPKESSKKLPPMKITLELFEGSAATFTWPKVAGVKRYVVKVTHKGKEFTNTNSLLEEKFEFTLDSNGRYDVRVTAIGKKGPIAKGRNHIDTFETTNNPVARPADDLLEPSQLRQCSGLILEKNQPFYFNWVQVDAETHYTVKIMSGNKKIATISGTKPTDGNVMLSYPVSWKDPGRYDVFFYMFDVNNKIIAGGIRIVFMPSGPPNIQVEFTASTTTPKPPSSPVKTDYWSFQWTDDTKVHYYSYHVMKGGIEPEPAFYRHSDKRSRCFYYLPNAGTYTFLLVAIDQDEENPTLLDWGKREVTIP